jgi:hypothetical protein
VIEERVTSEGEPYVAVPPVIVRGGEVQRDRDKRMYVLHAGGLDVDVGEGDSLIVLVRWSNTTA